MKETNLILHLFIQAMVGILGLCVASVSLQHTLELIDYTMAVEISLLFFFASIFIRKTIVESSFRHFVGAFIFSALCVGFMVSFVSGSFLETHTTTMNTLAGSFVFCFVFEVLHFSFWTPKRKVPKKTKVKVL